MVITRYKISWFVESLQRDRGILQLVIRPINQITGDHNNVRRRLNCVGELNNLLQPRITNNRACCMENNSLFAFISQTNSFI